MPRKARRRRIRTGVGVLSAAVLFGGAGVAEAEAATLIKSDLDFVLEQIKISENHAAGGQLSGTGANQISNPLFPYGLRTVDGEMNNLLPGQKEFGAADNVFNRLVPPLFRPAEKLTFDPDGPGPAQVGDDTSYTAKKGIVEDSQPRTISNLIVDQTENNPAAVKAAKQNEGSSGSTTTTARRRRTRSSCPTGHRTRVFRRRTTRGSRCSASSSTTASTWSPRATAARSSSR